MSHSKTHSKTHSKMHGKIHSKLISAFFTVFMLTACATPTVVQTPEQITGQVCPPLQSALAGLHALVGLPASAKIDLDAVTPIIAGVCAAGAMINLTSLQTLQQTALPTIIDTVKASGMAAEQQNSVILDITAAQIILSATVQANAQASAQTSINSAVKK